MSKASDSKPPERLTREKRRGRPWPNERPHMRPAEKGVARQILGEVETAFGAERAAILSKNNEEPTRLARIAALDLFPWSALTTAAFFGTTPAVVYWARKQAKYLYPREQRKVDDIRRRLNLPAFDGKAKP